MKIKLSAFLLGFTVYKKKVPIRVALQHRLMLGHLWAFNLNKTLIVYLKF